jgi:prepilin-type N-terminal cleavage/methylation domain-containing protein
MAPDVLTDAMPAATHRGLTLIELLIVITIIMIIAALIIAQMGRIKTDAKMAQTGVRISSALTGLSQLGQNEGSMPFRLQQLATHQAGDPEPGFAGLLTLGPADATGLPTVGTGTWGERGRSHLAFPWGKKFPDPLATTGGRLLGPEHFRLRDLSPFNTRKLLTIANLLPTRQSDPMWADTQYMTNRGVGESWNDAWGHPLVIGAALYQPTWKTSTAVSTIPGWRDDAWSAPGDPTPDMAFSAYGPLMETPAAPGDRSARKALLDHLKLYQYNRSLYVSVAAVGPRARVDEAKLRSTTASDWADSPTTPTIGTLDELWAQANWVCQQAKTTPFDQDWNELSFDNPRWTTVRDAYLDKNRYDADANKSHYVFRGYERCQLAAPTEYK